MHRSLLSVVNIQSSHISGSLAHLVHLKAVAHLNHQVALQTHHKWWWELETASGHRRKLWSGWLREVQLGQVLNNVYFYLCLYVIFREKLFSLTYFWFIFEWMWIMIIYVTPLIWCTELMNMNFTLLWHCAVKKTNIISLLLLKGIVWHFVWQWVIVIVCV